MSTTKGEGNRTPCTADVLNAVLDMNMNNPHMAAAAAAAVGNNNHHMQHIPFSAPQNIITSSHTSMPQISSTTTMSEPNFAFPSSSGPSSNKMDTTPPAPLIHVPSSLSMPMSHLSDISAQSTSLTSLQPPVSITTSFSTGHLSEYVLCNKIKKLKQR